MKIMTRNYLIRVMTMAICLITACNTASGIENNIHDKDSEAEKNVRIDMNSEELDWIEFAYSSDVKEGYDIYLCIGQSNMAGRGYLLDSDKNEVVEGVYLLDNEGKPVPATHPFNQYSTIRKNMDMQQMSLCYSFSKKMREAYPERPILLVCNARGGTSITQWMNDSEEEYYKEAVDRCTEALKYGSLKGILWHQGCSDSKKLVDEYMSYLKDLVKGLRKDLKAQDAPFVAGELPYWRTSSEDFNMMINEISEKIPYTSCVSAEGLGMRNDEDDPHFSRDALITLGERYADALIKLISKE